MGQSAAPVVVLMAVGVLVAIAGHVVKSRTLQGCGIALLFVATAAMVLGGFLSYNDNPNSDPRPTEPRPQRSP